MLTTILLLFLTNLFIRCSIAKVAKNPKYHNLVIHCLPMPNHSYHLANHIWPFVYLYSQYQQRYNHSSRMTYHTMHWDSLPKFHPHLHIVANHLDIRHCNTYIYICTKIAVSRHHKYGLIHHLYMGNPKDKIR